MTYAKLKARRDELAIEVAEVNNQIADIRRKYSARGLGKGEIHKDADYIALSARSSAIIADLTQINSELRNHGHEIQALNERRAQENRTRKDNGNPLIQKQFVEMYRRMRRMVGEERYAELLKSVKRELEPVDFRAAVRENLNSDYHGA